MDAIRVRDARSTGGHRRAEPTAEAGPRLPVISRWTVLEETAADCIDEIDEELERARGRLDPLIVIDTLERQRSALLGVVRSVTATSAPRQADRAAPTRD